LRLLRATLIYLKPGIMLLRFLDTKPVRMGLLLHFQLTLVDLKPEVRLGSAARFGFGRTWLNFCRATLVNYKSGVAFIAIKPFVLASGAAGDHANEPLARPRPAALARPRPCAGVTVPALNRPNSRNPFAKASP
jgi:hypothetical protein